MAHAGPDFYDDDAVFATYQGRRQRPDSPNDTMEKPVIVQLIGEVAGKHVLDLGCGDAAIGRDLLQRGAASYLGVEGSHKMAALARQTLAGTPGQVVMQTIEAWTAPVAAFDLTVSRLVFHYVADLTPVFAAVFRSLAGGGKFVFSVEHPVITSCNRGWPAGTRRQDWVVDDYFSTGERVTSWMGGTVKKYHRTVEDYFRLLRDAGFEVEALREACPQRNRFDDPQTYERRKRIPLFLVLAARKATCKESDMASSPTHDNASNFPSGIGKPALRALDAAGYTRLEQLANVREADLGKLHGMGPKSIGLLHDALAAQGLAFADDTSVS
ncbi:MAG: methyltransferase domain-containing protein [Anaerolineae bacterium]|nr:methyltransferase domain-containing protein [Anaerolineae bacterium]